ncbi:MAG: hypothetical protein M3N43_03015 [Actinomycetota bacterium]|nr:hypothetical protein [Actinomycetota bacterium]
MSFLTRMLDDLAQHDTCELCDSDEDVRWWDSCPSQIHGPAPLCPDHRRDVADECAETHGLGGAA